MEDIEAKINSKLSQIENMFKDRNGPLVQSGLNQINSMGKVEIVEDG